MNRKLILIANKGEDSHELPGVAIDMEHYERFFRSANGGAWEDGEMQIYLEFSSAQALHDYIMMTNDFHKVDYWLIVFCGHGYLDANDDTILCMSDGSEVKVSELKTWVQYTPCTLIADSCRQRAEIEGNLVQLRESMYSEVTIGQDPEACKALYNRLLEQLPCGSFYTAYGASKDECAGDNDELGGIYSFFLLDRADKERQRLATNLINDGDSFSTLAQVHDIAYPLVIERRHGQQHPVRSANTGNIPFVVIA